MILLAIIIFLTVFEAIHEGLALQKKGTIAGVIEFVKLVGITAIIPIILYVDRYDGYLYSSYKFWRYFILEFVLGWVFIRYSLFWFIHNLSAHIDLYHIGSVKLYDRIIARITEKQPPAPFFWITSILAFTVGVTLIVKL